MTKKTQLQELYGDDKYNHFLLISERTPFNKLKLGTLQKKDLLVVIGDMMDRYNVLRDESKSLGVENSKLLEQFEQLHNEFDEYRNETFLTKPRDSAISSPDSQDVPDVIKTIDTSTSVVKNFSKEGRKDGSLVGGYPQWN